MVAPVSLPTGQTTLTTRLFATVDGVPTAIYSADTAHSVDAYGTASIELPVPLPAHFGPDAGLNKRIEIQAGHDERGGLATIFSGRLIDRTADVSDSGRVGRLRAEGWSALLNFGDPKDLVFAGPARLDDMFRALCRRRGVPMYLVDNVTWPDGVTRVTLGGVPDIDDGNVIIPRDVPPLTWFDQRVRPYGYRIFDQPNGILRLMRISGLPPTTATIAATITEAGNVYQLGRSDSLREMVTYWEIFGAEWTDSDGVRHAPRSFPASIPFESILNPPGYRKQSKKHDFLVSYPQVDAVRNVYEIDSSRPKEIESWEIAGNPRLQPGNVVAVESATHGLVPGSRRWLMSLRQTVSDSGYVASMTGWAGSGKTLPAGNDCTSITVRTAPLHLGDEYVGWYAVPSPSGTSYEIPFTVPDYYSSITLYAKAHGINSYYLTNDKSDAQGNYEASVSKVEIWQGGDKPVGTANLPALPENYAARLNYLNLANWTDIVVPVTGRLKPGAATLKVLSGEERQIAAGLQHDDFELRDIALRTCGAAEPAFPVEV